MWLITLIIVGTIIYELVDRYLEHKELLAGKRDQDPSN